MFKSEHEETFDDNDRICPYCGGRYQVESEDYSEAPRDEECFECGKTYTAYEEFSVTHHAVPDCELNGEQHKWAPASLGGGRYHDFCKICHKCKPINP